MRSPFHYRLLEAPPFRDRFDAGRQLAQQLPPGLDRDAVVVGLARGGVQVAVVIAEALDASLDVLAVRKVRHPFQPEYALGAVAPGGDGVYVRGRDGLTAEQVEAAVARTRAEADELDRKLHAASPPHGLAGRAVVLVDDGLATGATMVAAARWARGRESSRVVGAVPVGAVQSQALVAAEVDELVCAYVSGNLVAVGIWYEDFSQVEDAEVLRLLAADAARRHGAGVT